MDKIKNPFSPGAGSPPPELAGRDAILEQAHVLLGRVRLKRPEKSILMTGLRGVGKTVLLNEIERRTTQLSDNSYKAHEDRRLASLLVPHMRRLLYDLNRIAGAGNKVKRDASDSQSFISGIKISMGK